LGTAERKQREKDRRRENIINAAEHVILKRGFEAATMDEIAEKAELSKGTLYLYFKNKNALYLAIYERGSSKLNRQFAKVLAMDKPGLELVGMLGETYLKFVRENPIYFNACSHYESIQDYAFLKKNKIAQRCEDNAREAMALITRTLQIGMQDGSIDDSYNPKELAVMIWASSRGIVQVAHLKRMGYHFKIMDDMQLDVESVFTSFIQLLGSGMSKKT
jgi:TetR/AcrR family transcriptional regulator